MPITLGILAQSRQAVAASDFVLLETVALSGSEASVTFSNLNASYGSLYKHLQVRLTARTNRASTLDGITLRLNGDTGNNYSRHILQGGGGSVGASGVANTSFILASYVTANNNAANSFQATVIDILDPFITTKNTTIRAFGGFASDTGFVTLTSGAFYNTAAITSITFDQENGPDFVSGSRFSLYGVKG